MIYGKNIPKPTREDIEAKYKSNLIAELEKYTTNNELELLIVYMIEFEYYELFLELIKKDKLHYIYAKVVAKSEVLLKLLENVSLSNEIKVLCKDIKIKLENSLNRDLHIYIVNENVIFKLRKLLLLLKSVDLSDNLSKEIQAELKKLSRMNLRKEFNVLNDSIHGKLEDLMPYISSIDLKFPQRIDDLHKNLKTHFKKSNHQNRILKLFKDFFPMQRGGLTKREKAFKKEIEALQKNDLVYKEHQKERGFN